MSVTRRPPLTMVTRARSAVITLNTGILGRYQAGYDRYYVNVGIGRRHIDWARNLQSGSPGASTELVMASWLFD